MRAKARSELPKGWQAFEQGAWPHHYANADDVLVSDRNWLLEQWQQALLLGDGALLVIDEIQKVGNPALFRHKRGRQALLHPPCCAWFMGRRGGS
jgi:hypothetical protein